VQGLAHGEGFLGAAGVGRVFPDGLTFGDGVLEFDPSAQAANELENPGLLDPLEQKPVVQLSSIRFGCERE